MSSMRKLINLFENVEGVPGLNQQQLEFSGLLKWQTDAIESAYTRIANASANLDIAKQNAVDELYAGGVIDSASIQAARDYMAELDDVIMNNDEVDFSIDGEDSSENMMLGVFEDDSYDVNFIRSSISRLYNMATSEEELKRMVGAETGYSQSSNYDSLFQAALNSFLNKGTGEEEIDTDDLDYTDYRMRQSELGLQEGSWLAKSIDGVEKRFKSSDTAGRDAWTNSYAKPQKQSKPVAKSQSTGVDLDLVWNKVQEVVANIFPDGDPIDYLGPWLQKQGITDFRIGDTLDAAAVKNGYDDIYDYYDEMKKDFDIDRPNYGLDESSGQAIHTFTTSEKAYDATQSGIAFASVNGQTVENEVKNGDILVIPNEGVVGICATWPIAVTKEHGELHSMKPEFSAPEDIASQAKCSVDAVHAALALAKEMGLETIDENVNEAKSASKIDPAAVNALATLPLDDAKARAVEIITTSTTDEAKKSYLIRQVDGSTSTKGLLGILYNMILSGEGMRVQGSSYSRKFGGKSMEEDLNNGYGDLQEFDADDFFPTGATGPVSRKAGPSGARHGDNPLSKSMRTVDESSERILDETHRELVYSYRNFLKESSKSTKHSVITVDHFYRDKNGNPVSTKLYTTTDGNGKFPLANDGGVFFASSEENEHIHSVDGEPTAKPDNLYVFRVNGKLGLYDDNFVLKHEFSDLSDLEDEMEDNPDFMNPYTINY